MATENCPKNLVKEGVYLNKKETGVTDDTPFILPSVSCTIHSKSNTPVYEDEHIIAFKDIKPLAPVHILLIPKKHIPDITGITADDAELIGRIHLAAVKIALDLGIDQSGFRLVNNCREDAGQEVFHLHYHLLGGENLGPFVG
jgi:histidine triad (HIT) family protein